MGACALPGVSVKFDTFIPCMWRAVATGHVEHRDAVFVADGLRHGFTAGIDVSSLSGHRWFANYKSAVEGRGAVTPAIMKRVEAGKTLQLGTWSNSLAHDVKNLFSSSAIFPMGAVGKAGSTTDLRPTDDHTRTGVNSASTLDFLRHSLDAYSEISWFLQLDYFMRVSDVEAAFTLLPLHPDVWPFFMFRFFADQSSEVLSLFMHICGDFGAAGMPGTFKKFFVDVVVQMARSVHVLTLPMPVYVDDCTIIGPDRVIVDAQMDAFHDFAGDVCGVFFKVAKDRMASQVQLALGFVWDSTTLTRVLEERKLLSYLDMFAEYATRPTLTLREMQQLAGRMQRCIMTFPPGGAWMIVPLFMLMARLRLPHHRRRTTKEVRDNFKYCASMLRAGIGRGFYSFSNFIRAPSVWTDASKSRGLTGGGFVSACGRYDFWTYSKKAGRKLIDYLEGDTVVVACMRLAHLWSGCIVSIFCDNKAFEQSGEKGRSRVARLNDLLKELFLLMVKYRFVIDWNWISTHDNVNADHLSRDREDQFLTTVYETECWSADTTPVRMAGAGRQRVLPEKRGVLDETYSCLESKSASGESASSVVPAPDAEEDGAATYFKRATAGTQNTFRAKRGGSMMLILAMVGCFLVQDGDAMPMSRIQASMSYSRASLFEGLPLDLVADVESVMDNRLASSSWRKVRSGLRIWREVADARGWSHVLATDDPHRGGKLVALVMHMLADTDLVWGSIQTYVWGVRVWMQSQHQADPVMGVLNWDTFMDGVKVLSWVPAEPRRRCPIEVVEKILDAINLNSFWEVQLALLILVCLFTFSRTECPCPKTYAGRESFDAEEHFGVRDFDIKHVAAHRALMVRFRKIKQDQRVERPEARGDGDWVVIGDVPGTKFSAVEWFLRVQRFHGQRADRTAPMFLDRDMRRPLLYRKFFAQFRELQLRVGVPDDKLSGPHGLRVEGYNGTKSRLGVELAVAQGGWRSTAHKRYERFSMERVVRIPAVIAGVDDGDDDDPAATIEAGEREAGPPQRRMRRADLRRANDDEDDDNEDDDDEFDDDLRFRACCCCCCCRCCCCVFSSYL